MRILSQQNKDSSFNSLLPLFSTDTSHSSPPTSSPSISVALHRKASVCVRAHVCEQEKRLKTDNFHRAHTFGPEYCIL